MGTSLRAQHHGCRFGGSHTKFEAPLPVPRCPQRRKAPSNRAHNLQPPRSHQRTTGWRNDAGHEAHAKCKLPNVRTQGVDEQVEKHRGENSPMSDPTVWPWSGERYTNSNLRLSVTEEMAHEMPHLPCHPPPHGGGPECPQNHAVSNAFWRSTKATNVRADLRDDKPSRE